MIDSVKQETKEKIASLCLVMVSFIFNRVFHYNGRFYTTDV